MHAEMDVMKTHPSVCYLNTSIKTIAKSKSIKNYENFLTMYLAVAKWKKDKVNQNSIILLFVRHIYTFSHVTASNKKYVHVKWQIC